VFALCTLWRKQGGRLPRCLVGVPDIRGEIVTFEESTVSGLPRFGCTAECRGGQRSMSGELEFCAAH
jgi:hypothetical protein